MKKVYVCPICGLDEIYIEKLDCNCTAEIECPVCEEIVTVKEVQDL